MSRNVAECCGMLRNVAEHRAPWGAEVTEGRQDLWATSGMAAQPVGLLRLSSWCAVQGTSYRSQA